MKNRTATLILALLVLVLTGCGRATTLGDIPTLDLAAAIDNSRPFDLDEISDNIEFIPLDNTHKDGLIGEIDKIDESKERFYVKENASGSPIKIFDRSGQFLTTRGRFGRGPGEISRINSFAIDPENDNLYMAVWAVGHWIIACDHDGREFARDSMDAIKLVFSGETLLAQPGPLSRMSVDQPLGTKKPFMEVFTPDLHHTASLKTTEKGLDIVVTQSDDEFFSFIPGPKTIMSANGERLLVKDALSDTLTIWRDGALEPVLLLDHGKYAVPAGAFGFNAPATAGDSYAVWNLRETGRYILIDAVGFGKQEAVSLVFDRNEGDSGFSAIGPASEHGLFLDGLAFTPMYVRDNRLVGYMQAFDIVDNAEKLTRPDLRALAATLKEDSNPVIVVATLKK